MGIRIAEITAKNLGPIANLTWKLATVNLVYGKNESGKTHLVEFLLQSLFKNKSYPGLRQLPAAGQVTVSGLGDELVHFSPSSKKKLEEYLKSEARILPANISRLLVVRAGELSLVDNPQVGIDRSVLDEYLSNTGLINAIRAKIPAATQKASVSDGTIQGNRQGMVKDHFARKDDLIALDKLTGQVNAEYSTGYRGTIQQQLKEAHDQLIIEQQAKAYLAYSLHQAIQRLYQQVAEISVETLQQAESNLADYRLKTASLKKLVESQQAKIAECADFPWLKAALEDYQTLTAGKTGAARPWLLILAGLFLAGSVGLILIRQPYLAIALLLIGAALGFLHSHNLQQASLRAAQNSEIDRIKGEFQQKFNRPLTDLPSLRLVYEAQKEASIAAGTLASQVNDLEGELAQLEQTISDGLFKLTGDRLPQDAWAAKVAEISHSVNEMRNQLEKQRPLLAALQVEEIDFRGEPAARAYDDPHYKEIMRQVNDLTGKLNLEDDRLTSLRQRLAQETRLDISTPWEKLIEALQGKRNNCAREYQDVTSKLLAGIAVNSALDEIYQEEEKSIREGLQSRQVTDTLQQMTTHYNRLEFENGVLRVADAYAEYNFGDLSTAAQEQVLLALRLGFSSRCFYDQSLFLVLDDAFQHSDWSRREHLVDSVMAIARQGWQIIYLTMDDHIRGLFQARMEQLFPGDYQLLEI